VGAEKVLDHQPSGSPHTRRCQKYTTCLRHRHTHTVKSNREVRRSKCVTACSCCWVCVCGDLTRWIDQTHTHTHTHTLAQESQSLCMNNQWQCHAHSGAMSRGVWELSRAGILSRSKDIPPQSVNASPDYHLRTAPERGLSGFQRILDGICSYVHNLLRYRCTLKELIERHSALVIPNAQCLIYGVRGWIYKSLWLSRLYTLHTRVHARECCKSIHFKGMVCRRRLFVMWPERLHLKSHTSLLCSMQKKSMW